MVTKRDYEAILQSQLDFAGYEYQREYRFDRDRLWRADFYLRRFNLIIEVEGIKYRGQGGRHQTGAGYQADCEKYNTLSLMGYRLLRFTPAQVTGKAKRNNKARTRMEPAIDIIDNLCLGARVGKINRNERGYAKEAITRWPLPEGTH